MKTKTSHAEQPVLDTGFIHQRAEEDARNLGWRNYPMLYETYGQYFEEFHQMFQSLIHDLAQGVDPGVVNTTANQATIDAKDATQKLQNDQDAERKKLGDLEWRLSTIAIPRKTSRLHFIMVVIVNVLLCLIDGYYNSEAIEVVLGNSYFWSLLAALVIAGGLAFWAHFFRSIVYKGKTVTHQWIIGCGMLAGAFAIFMGLASMRLTLILQNPSEYGAGNSVGLLPIALISFSIFFVAVVFSWVQTPSEEDVQVTQSRNEICFSISSAHTAIASFDEKIKEVERVRNEIHSHCMKTLHDGAMEESKIITGAEACYSAFKKTNLLHRRDGNKPEQFDTTYPFAFTTYFIHKFNRSLQS
jgi:hypothetical protein